MDKIRPAYSLKAPGAAGGDPAVRLPGREFPGIDSRLVVPEVTRDEIVGGRRMVASPAQMPHARQHGELSYVLRAHVAAGYVTPVDLLTRHGVKSDFASDSCVLRDGIDPSTGTRYLEELAFEIVSEQQSERVVTDKAVEMHRRGVRRIFAVMLKGWQVCEWSSESGAWRPVNGSITDRCLAVPLRLSALLDAAEADNAVAEALVAKGNPVLQKREAAAKDEGRSEGQAESILKILAARGINVGEAQRQEILLCRDPERLDLWLSRAVAASSVDDVFAGS
jgi:Putative restriction endonuclease